MKRCPRCNNKVKDSDTFCIHCGYNFKNKNKKHTRTKIIVTIILVLVVFSGIMIIVNVVRNAPSPTLQHSQQTSQTNTNNSSGNGYNPTKVHDMLHKVQYQDHKFVSKLTYDKHSHQNLVLIYLTPYAIHKFESPNIQDKKDEPASHTGSVEDTSITDKINSQLSGLNQYLPDNKGTLQTKLANYDMHHDSNKGLGPVHNNSGTGKPEY